MAPEVEAGTYGNITERSTVMMGVGAAAQQNTRSFAYDISMFFF